MSRCARPRRQLGQRRQPVGGQLGRPAAGRCAAAARRPARARRPRGRPRRRPSSSAARARAKLIRACGPVDGRARARPGRRPRRPPARSQPRWPGPSGSLDQRAGQLADRLADRPGRQSRGGRHALLAADRQHGQRARQRPAGVRGGGLDRRRVGRRVADEHPHQPPAAQLGLAGCRRLLQRVALGRLGREHVDVGEDRLGQQIQRLGLEPGRDAGGGEPPPGHPGADPVGAEQRLEAAPGAHLPAARAPSRRRAGRRGRRPRSRPGSGAAPPGRRRGYRLRTVPRAAARRRGRCATAWIISSATSASTGRRTVDDLRRQLVPGLVSHDSYQSYKFSTPIVVTSLGETCAQATYP